jgi:hypothetical protein
LDIGLDYIEITDQSRRFRRGPVRQKPAYHSVDPASYRRWRYGLRREVLADRPAHFLRQKKMMRDRLAAHHPEKLP